MLRWLILAVALVCASAGLWRLATAADGLSVSQDNVGDTPVTIFSMKEATSAPAVVIAHGFAGSQQLMQPFAITLARSGYLVVTYDLLGHGRNPQPLTGDVTKVEGATANLVTQLAEVADYARALPGSDGRLAVLGHSMATDVIVRYATANPDVSATIAVSMFSPAVTAATPKNLLVIVGAWEAGLRAEALRAVGLAAGGEAEEGVLYGDPATGSARMAVFADHVEHVGVLYSSESLTAARDWLNLVFGRAVEGQPDARGASIGMYFIMVIAAFAVRLLPRLASPPKGFGHRWSSLLPLGIGPALLAPLILWKAPVDFLPVPVGGYLALHFLVFGLITWAGLFWLNRDKTAGETGSTSWARLAVCVAASTAFCLLAIYLPIDLFVTSFAPTGVRWLLVAAMALGLLPYFLADEFLTRGRSAPAGAYFFTKICFLVSIAFAIALNFEGLFFLIIIVPVILVFFILFGLLSSWIYRRTGHPAVGAITNALLFAWAIAVTFPILAS